MNRILNVLGVTGVLIAGTHAFAEDPMKRTAMTEHEAMEVCMTKQQTSSDVSMSKSAMKRYCKDQIKQQKKTGAPMEAPPTDSPKN